MIFHNRIEADVARTPTTPLSAYISDFLMACESGLDMKHPLSERTIVGYRKSLREFDSLLGQPTLAGLTIEAASEVISEKRRKSKSNARLVAATAKTFSSWLHRRKHTKTNRLKALGVPVFNGRRNAFTDIEFKKIRDSLALIPSRSRPRSRAVVLLALGSGMRSDEIRRLDFDNVHITSPLSQSWALVEWETAKTKQMRRVRIAEDAAAAIHEYIAADRPEMDGPLFLNEEGKPYTYEGWRMMFAGISHHIEQYGVKDFMAHRCRHQWATMGARIGMTHSELRQEGGWGRGSKVVDRYISEIPFEEMQKRPSPMTAFLRAV